MGVGAQKSGGAAALPAPPSPRSLTCSVHCRFNCVYMYYSQLCLNRQLYKIDTLEKQKPGVGHVLPLFESALRDGHLSKMDIFACSTSPKTCLS